MNIDLESIYAEADFCALRDVPLPGESPQHTPRRRVVNALLYLAGQPERPAWGQVRPFLEGLAAAAGCGYAMARVLWERYKKCGWRGLCDGRSLPRVGLVEGGARSLRFRAYVQKVAEANQLSTQRAIEHIQDSFRYAQPGTIPGFETWQPCGKEGALPPGVSATSLRGIIRKHELANIRQGLKSNHATLPMVLTTRAGVRPGTVYEFDDMWHDHLVLVPGQKTPVRVLEFGCLDVASGCRIHWGFCPRIIRDDGTKQGLTSRMFVLFLAYVLRYIGYDAEQGVTLVVEHATASVDKRLKELLEGAGVGIRIRTSGIVGTVQKGMGGYLGAVGGNPRGKTHLEASHAALHKINAFIPGQTGKDRQHQQESTLGRIREAEWAIRYTNALRAAGRGDLAEAVQMPFLTLREFADLLTLNYTAWNARTDHHLEGWDARHVKEISLADGVWESREKYLADTDGKGYRELPAPILALIAAQPERMRLRRMSPTEVWTNERGKMRKIPMGLYIDMIKDETICGHKLRVRHQQLQLQDKLVCADPLIYRAVCYTPDARMEYLQEGEEYHCVANPFDLAHLVIVDNAGRILGMCPQLTRASVADEDAIHHQTGKVAAMKAALLADQRARWAGDTARELAKHEANAALFVEGGVLTPDGKRAAKPLPEARKRVARPLPREAEVDAFAGMGELPARTDAPDSPSSPLSYPEDPVDFI